MNSQSRTSVVLSVVLSLMMFGCVTVSDPNEYPTPDGDTTLPEDDVSTDTTPIGAPGIADTTRSFPEEYGTPILLVRKQNPQAITVDKSAMFWTEYNSEKGAGAIMMVLHGEQVVRMLVEQELPVGIVTDDTHIYWTDMGAGTVMSLSKETGKLTKLASDQGSPFQLALGGDHVFFTNIDQGTIARVHKAGGAVKVLVDDQDHPGAIAVATNQDGVREVFWVTLGSVGELKVVAETGGVARVLASGHNFSTGFVIDAANVYWSDPVSRSVKLFSFRFNKTDTLATNQYLAAGLTTDNENVYWVTQTDGAIKSLNKTDGATRTLITGQDMPEHIAVGETHIFWTDKEFGSIFKMAK